MTALCRATLTGLLLFVAVATAHAERIVATDAAPAGGSRIDPTTGDNSNTGLVVIDAATGTIAAYRLSDVARPLRLRAGGVALARLAADRPPARPEAVVVQIVPEVAAPAEPILTTARASSPFGPPAGGWALLLAGLVSVAAWYIRSRLRPAYA